MPAREGSTLASTLSDALRHALEREERKRSSLVKEAESAQKAESLGKWATLVTANLYRIPADAERADVEDWDVGGRVVTLKFDLKTHGSPRQEAEAAFAKARRLRRGSAVLEGLIAESDRTCSALRGWASDLEALANEKEADGSTTRQALDELSYAVSAGFKSLKLKPPDLAAAAGATSNAAGVAGGGVRSAPPSQPSSSGGWPGRAFRSPSGVPILVGRRRVENELLSTKIAREPDLWFHVRDAPGAHVVLQLSRAGTRRRSSGQGTAEGEGGEGEGGEGERGEGEGIAEGEGAEEEGAEREEEDDEAQRMPGEAIGSRRRHVRHAHGASRTPRQRGRGRVTGDEPEADEFNGAEEADVQMCADLAAFFSDCKNEKKARVSVTSAKWVSKPKGAPLGAVAIKKELRSVVAVPDRVAHLAGEEAATRAERKESEGQADGQRRSARKR
jgi:hypothetical protein